ncbi:MAG TPA: TetR/AcrR family transcriptional regulator [Mycobacteriales bacterium]|nr:TetR/AcrR family transcriptional regulator [Mycobacteriales bacterium]
MTSQRHTAEGTERRGTPLLDAARECVLDVGLRRTTLADVARRAGVSRMTVYRQYADLQTLVSALLTRELLEVFEAVDTEVRPLPTARERLVAAALLVVGRVDSNDVYRRVLDLDPEMLLPLVVDRFGSTQRAALELVAGQVREGQSDGSVRAGDPERMATAVLLTCQSFVFSARLVDDATLAELRPMLDGYLR